jgi:hypothetical protein
MSERWHVQALDHAVGGTTARVRQPAAATQLQDFLLNRQGPEMTNCVRTGMCRLWIM